MGIVEGRWIPVAVTIRGGGKGGRGTRGLKPPQSADGGGGGGGGLAPLKLIQCQPVLLQNKIK